MKNFLKYVVPSVLAFALSGIYAIVDGFFVGNSVGDVGLSAINVVYPVVTLMQSAGTGIGMGGAVMWTVRRAEGQKEDGDEYVRTALRLLLLTSIVLTAVMLIFMDPVLSFLGAEGTIRPLGEEYLRIMVYGTTFQVFATGIVLDYLFVWVLQLGMAGAAWASILGQAVTMVCSFVYVWKEKLPVLGVCKEFGRKVCRIVQIGIAPFGLSLSPMISLLFMNRFCLSYGGETAVASYACIAYGLTIVYLLMQGVGDGSQPLMSLHYGEGKTKEVDRVRNMAYATAWVLALACMLILYMTRYDLGVIFGSSDVVMQMTGNAMPIFLAGLLFYAFSRITTSGFYATEQSLFSYICVYAEPVLLLILLLIVPRILRQDGVWLSMVLSQILTAGIACLLRQKEKKRIA